MLDSKLSNYLYENPIIAVVVIDNIEDAIPTVQSLLEGGIRAIELALRTDVAFDAIAKVNEELPEMLVAAGTVITTQQVEDLSKIGIKLAVSPGLNPDVISKAISCNLPFVPGVATPADIEVALTFNIKTLKFFPAESMGSVSYLKSASAPYAHLGLKFIPLGGITFKNFKDYLKCDNVLALGGSWIAKRSLINSGSWKQITKSAKEAVEQASQVRYVSKHVSLKEGLI